MIGHDDEAVEGDVVAVGRERQAVAKEASNPGSGDEEEAAAEAAAGHEVGRPSGAIAWEGQACAPGVGGCVAREPVLRVSLSLVTRTASFVSRGRSEVGGGAA